MKLAPTLHLPSYSVEPPPGYPPIPPENEAGDRILSVLQPVCADCLLCLAEQDVALDKVPSGGAVYQEHTRTFKVGSRRSEGRAEEGAF